MTGRFKGNGTVAKALEMQWGLNSSVYGAECQCQEWWKSHSWALLLHRVVSGEKKGDGSE